MTGRDALAVLLERVEAATGPWYVTATEADEWSRALGLDTDARVAAISAVQGSLDAALRLVERVLPAIPAFAQGSPSSSGWRINLYRGLTPTSAPYGQWEATVRKHAGPEHEGRCPTPALALLVCLLKALIQTAESDHGK